MRSLLFHSLEGRLPRRPEGPGGHGAHDGQRLGAEPVPESDKNAPQTPEAQGFDGWIGATIVSTNLDDASFYVLEEHTPKTFFLPTRTHLYLL